MLLPSDLQDPADSARSVVSPSNEPLQTTPICTSDSSEHLLRIDMAGPLSLRISSRIQLILAQPTYPHDIRDNKLSSLDGVRLVQRTLREPVNVRCMTCGELHSFAAKIDDWKVEIDDSVTPSAEEVESLASNVRYVAFHDIILTPLATARSGKQDTSSDGSKHVHIISTRAELTAVLTHLQKRLDPLQLNFAYWLIASENCRVITSVSSDNESFALSTSKKVAFIITAWQRLFDMVSESQCIPNEALFNDHFGVYLDTWLSKIKRAPGFSSLTALLHGTKNAGVLDIDDVAIGGSFRSSQQASSLDARHILAWQDVYEKVVLRASAAEGTYFAWQFSPEGEYRAPSFGVQDMLRELGVKKSTIRLFQSKHPKIMPGRDAQLACELKSAMKVLGPLVSNESNAEIRAAQQSAVREIVLAKLKSGAYGRVQENFVRAVLAAL
ncbi:hypothetical protein DOTSEDRAFT_39618 [Dothistroma septosporum NZE10]|uniref:Uncharacterized protein n=1 Tax=Dothistroma septosporum (strain NZE10 / CBS 128990) TaxID=675120 RepID=M2XG80_DOTSN|nr:hypothetical protein DOTSEDRAFT_39618 [Dothistroma septosporum NZE10]